MIDINRPDRRRQTSRFIDESNTSTTLACRDDHRKDKTPSKKDSGGTPSLLNDNDSGSDTSRVKFRRQATYKYALFIVQITDPGWS